MSMNGVCMHLNLKCIYKCIGHVFTLKKCSLYFLTRQSGIFLAREVTAEAGTREVN